MEFRWLISDLSNGMLDIEIVLLVGVLVYKIVCELFEKMEVRLEVDFV